MFLLKILHKSRKNGCSVSILFLKCFDVQSIHHRFHKIHVTTCIIYSVIQTQPDTRAEPKSRPQVRFEISRGRSGSTVGPLFKSASALGPQVVRSGFALSPLGVRFASALGGSLCALMLLPPLSPAPCIPVFQIHCPAVVEKRFIIQQRSEAYTRAEQSSDFMENINKITRILPHIQQRIVTLRESRLNNSKIRDTILRDENVCVSRPSFDTYASQC